MKKMDHRCIEDRITQKSSDTILFFFCYEKGVMSGSLIHVN